MRHVIPRTTVVVARAIAIVVAIWACTPLLENCAAGAQPIRNPDRSAQFAQRHPSFGGFWLDSLGNVHVYTTRLADSVDLRLALTDELRNRGYSAAEVNDFEGKFFFHAAHFSYTELSNWQHLIARASVERVPGYQSSGVRHRLNQIRFGLTDPRGVAMIKQIAESLQVPARAVLVEIEDIFCTLEARPGILVSPRDSITGEVLMAGTRAFAREGSFTDSVRVPDYWKGRVEFLPLTYERAGIYEVGIVVPGYRPWRVTGIRVERDACHVTTVRLTAKLLRKF
jgi:hypothetical protein